METSKKQVNICGGKLYPTVNPNNDGQMVREGLRVPNLIIDRKVFEKSEFEKKQLKLLKFKKEFGTMYKAPNREHLQHRLTVYMKKSNVRNYKSTHSFMCYSYEVQGILSMLRDNNYVINVVYYNHKKYSI